MNIQIYMMLYTTCTWKYKLYNRALIMDVVVKEGPFYTHGATSEAGTAYPSLWPLLLTL